MSTPVSEKQLQLANERLARYDLGLFDADVRQRLLQRYKANGFLEPDLDFVLALTNMITRKITVSFE